MRMIWRGSNDHQSADRQGGLPSTHHLELCSPPGLQFLSLVPPTGDVNPELSPPPPPPCRPLPDRCSTALTLFSHLLTLKPPPCRPLPGLSQRHLPRAQLRPGLHHVAELRGETQQALHQPHGEAVSPPPPLPSPFPPPFPPPLPPPLPVPSELSFVVPESLLTGPSRFVRLRLHIWTNK